MKKFLLFKLYIYYKQRRRRRRRRRRRTAKANPTPLWPSYPPKPNLNTNPYPSPKPNSKSKPNLHHSAQKKHRQNIHYLLPFLPLTKNRLELVGKCGLCVCVWLNNKVKMNWNEWYSIELMFELIFELKKNLSSLWKATFDFVDFQVGIQTVKAWPIDPLFIFF